ncbi:peroxide stress protein YaaA [Oligella urethralis]|uniref:peroxide stress protein YaaA n=1 Tax=Oligella urethralis TaxID=90245 RepID=UPI000CFF0067|nr:peroxide stress protein YaaA [Oligella urethralis]AVL71546.1 peroxide stress protein YaaA [Oligella urethralis]
MLFLLSPAKKLNYDSPLAADYEFEQPLFVAQATELIEVLKTKSEQEIADLMKLSDSLASLNVERYQAWEPSFDQSNSRQAILAFNGDVYEGLEASTLNQKQLAWTNQHVVILSGLYGVLRPLDLMRPYRLEMGTRLATSKGKKLYEFWDEQIADYLNQRLAEQKNPLIVNLASEEYFKAVKKDVLKYPVVQCVFKEERDGAYKIISFSAKRARGLMCRYAIENGIDDLEGLKQFNLEGYSYDEASSSEDSLVFLRPDQRKK